MHNKIRTNSEPRKPIEIHLVSDHVSQNSGESDEEFIDRYVCDIDMSI